ncbi:Rv3235 family protein [Mycolicibacillus trivialis]|uniref:Rv3235 family protein n=2 Tax=Mycolicibacillus trivialis TaxID=1798 RepID=UPI001F30AB9B|nr:Rv3235 family protein [Mycolicibacillus trivialis]
MIQPIGPAPQRAVAPVADYEPPPRTLPGGRPPAPLRRRSRPSRPRPARVPQPGLLPAARFADAALRRILEVIDRRRPVQHLRPLLSAGLFESLLAGGHATATGGPARTTAALQRVRLQASGAGEPPGAAEVFGTYRRGGRVHAIAGRVEQAGPGWRVVALHIG